MRAGIGYQGFQANDLLYYPNRFGLRLAARGPDQTTTTVSFLPALKPPREPRLDLYPEPRQPHRHHVCTRCQTGQLASARRTATTALRPITYVDERGGAHNHLVNEGTLAIRPPQGEFEPLSASAANQFTLSFRNGTRYIFESQGDLRVTPGLCARLRQIVDAWDNQLNFGYDANGQLWQITHRYKSGAGYEVRNIVTRTFDAAERVKTEADADADGSITSYSYDEAGNVIAIKDAEGHTTRFEYDAMNRKTATIDATGYRTATTLTLRGDVLAITNANGESLEFALDALGRKTAANDALGNRSEFRYDANGNLICSIDANAQAGLQPKNAFGYSEYRTYDELKSSTSRSIA